MPVKKAPGDLRLVQDFVNTLDVESGRDELRSAEDLRSWLGGRGLLRTDELVTEADLSWAAEVREGLRRLLAANAGHRPPGGPADPLALLNRAAATARPRLVFRPDGAASLEPDASGVHGAVGQILAVVFTSMVDGSWERLKVCVNDGCLWAFYDESKNRSGKWCTMAVCGNRMKARAYRERQASEA